MRDILLFNQLITGVFFTLYIWAIARGWKKRSFSNGGRNFVITVAGPVISNLFFVFMLLLGGSSTGAIALVWAPSIALLTLAGTLLVFRT